MMNKEIIRLLLLSFLSLGCKQAPPPISQFSMSGQFATPATVNFTNKSQNADRLQWDFGDGRTSIQQNPTITFDKHGKYTVTLIAFQKDSEKPDTSSQNLEITPSKLTVVKVVIEDLSFVNSQGAGWDMASGPDLVIKLMHDNRALATKGPITDIAPGNLPYDWNLRDQAIVDELDGELRVQLYDDDSFTNGDGIGEISWPLDELVKQRAWPEKLETKKSRNVAQVTLYLKWS